MRRGRRGAELVGDLDGAGDELGEAVAGKRIGGHPRPTDAGAEAERRAPLAGAWASMTEPPGAPEPRTARFRRRDPGRPRTDAVQRRRRDEAESRIIERCGEPADGRSRMKRTPCPAAASRPAAGGVPPLGRRIQRLTLAMTASASSGSPPGRRRCGGAPPSRPSDPSRGETGERSGDCVAERAFRPGPQRL